MTRETWKTRAGFILAAVGSAVGLGNIWRFPWMTANNGGSAFLLLYLGIVLLVGVPGLLGAFVIGRRSQRNPVGALRDLSGGSRLWGAFGLFAVATTLLLVSFYSVVGGWFVRYTAASATASYFGQSGAYFSAISHGPGALAFGFAFLAASAAIVYGGVEKGIERATKLMMPAIVILLVALTAWTFTRPGALDGAAFLLSPDVAYLRANALDILPAAVGQALFTLSLGTGTMITYASYLGEERSLPSDATTIAVLNTGVGVLAGLLVFPLLFSFGLDAGSGGPGAIFVSVASAFASLGFLGRVLGVAFFGVVLLAALSSAISMLEIPVAYLVDEHDVPRSRATVGVAGLVSVGAAACALDASVFGLLANTLVNLLMTAGLAGFLLFVGWVLGRRALAEYEAGAGEFARSLGTPWLLFVGVLIPVFLLFTLITGLLPVLGVSITELDVMGVRVASSTLSLVAAVVVTLLAVAGLRRPDSML
ncbi:sodium-dependent transporter [Halarchaeum sp. CBA1220]|uniref:sodium-dependent transporter n=1 Tax=Halarchaeum sp. CBA1220 TaxID=1853682 RepID=UPI000F3A9EC1|nr:sodium-dependent transporter [Halarchaeum sp. CBA1220]QLC32780.1 sodium-dependent transporter [Halarchaeum sp. CBA1220]